MPMARIIDGKALARKIREELKERIIASKVMGIHPGLAVIIVGDDPASRVYVNMKKKACNDLGIYSEEHALSEDVTQQELIALVSRLNKDPKISGVLVQLPLPKHINEDQVLSVIDPEKDVDGFHPVSVGRLVLGIPGFISCTPAGVMELIHEAGVNISGKECVVVGRSNIVGKPQALLLLREHGTVTICHSHTKDLAEVTRRADILLVAVGRPQMITGNMVKPGATVIDVGVNRLPDGRLVGDVDFESVAKVAGFITPVPGGVGPMTITMLMKNTVEAARGQAG
jgi:methylenetetrahydrofolate dehydrogenase (NADP+)/methenyltetrahydrofolate cyclohydrolase